MNLPYAPDNAGISADFSDNTNHVNLTGGDFGDVLIGGSGNDTLNGGGNDVLEGGLGNNTIDGGSGVNTVSYEHFDDGSGVGIAVTLSGGAAGNISGSGDAVDDRLSNIQNVRGSAFADLIIGDGNRNVIEGGGGADDINGGGGADVASYVHSADAVTVNLTTGANTGGDAQGDTLRNIENLYGSMNADTLTGDDQANIINGVSGADTIMGMGGNDRITIGATPTMVDGGTGTNTLAIKAGTSATLTDANFANIERVVVNNGASVDLSGVSTGERIFSQSVAGGTATIAGTQAADVMFGGAGTDTFNEMMAGFGRDVIYKADFSRDYLDVSGLGADLHFASINNGADTLIYGDAGHGAGTDQVVLKGIGLTAAQGAQNSGHIHGAMPA